MQALVSTCALRFGRQKGYRREYTAPGAARFYLDVLVSAGALFLPEL